VFKLFPAAPDALSGDATSPGSAYAYRGSLIGAAHQYELTDGGLAWRTGRRSGVWRYADIAAVRLSYRPTAMQARRFRADIAHRDGGHIAVLSTSKQTAALMEPQAGYRAFILQLHRRMAEAGSTATLRSGLRPAICAVIVFALALVGLAMAALLVRALLTGEIAGVVFIIGFAAVFGWQIGGFVRRNRPRDYTFESVPGEVLP
jgi:hypothetical protein